MTSEHICLLKTETENYCFYGVYGLIVITNYPYSSRLSSVFTDFQVSDRGGGRCCGSPAVLLTPVLTWLSPSPVKIQRASCGRCSMKEYAFPIKAPVVLELLSRM